MHIIFQSSVTTGQENSNKSRNTTFLYDKVTSMHTFTCKMWFAIVLACLSFCEFGATCNVSQGKYFVRRK